MPKRYRRTDELYPFFTIDEDGDDDYQTPVDYTEAELADYERVMAEFYRWQDVIQKRFDEATHPVVKPRIDATAKQIAFVKKAMVEAREPGIDWSRPWTKEAQAALEKYPLP